MHQYFAYLCGCFTAKKQVDPVVLTRAGWRCEDISKKRSDDKASHVYYNEFINFCYAYNSNEGCVEWSREKNIESHCLNMQNEDVEYNIPKIFFYLMPFNLVIFSILVSAESEQLDDFKSIVYHLRKSDIQSSIPFSVEKDLLELYKLMTGVNQYHLSEVVEFGYKLKFFQIINTDADWRSETRETRRQQLFSLGVVQNDQSKEDGKYCQEYVNDTLNKVSVSIFNSWDALSLLDSFTIRCFKMQSFQWLEWNEAYYRMIYIQSLFQKYFLQSLNQRFKAMISLREEYNRDSLLGEFEQYERLWQFHKIAYTFLPLIIDKSMDTGLEINEEKQLLFEYIKDVEKKRQSENSKLLNSLLAVISGLTLFSAIWDFSCLVNEVYPYDSSVFGGSRRGYFAVSAIMFGLVVLVLVILICRKKIQRLR